MKKDKNEKLDEIVDEMDKYFKDWESGRKDPHSKLPRSKLDVPEKPLTTHPAPLVPYHQPDNVTTSWDKTMVIFLQIETEWPMVPFDIPVEQLQFSYSGMEGYFSYNIHSEKEFNVLKQIQQNDMFFKILVGDKDGVKTVASKCKIDHMSGFSDNKYVTFKFLSSEPREFHQFNKYREPVFKNETKDTIVPGEELFKGGFSSISTLGRVPGYFATQNMLSNVNLYDSKWNPINDMRDSKWHPSINDMQEETVLEIACRLCGKASKEVKVGNDFTRTCDTPGCPNNVFDGIKNFGAMVTPGEVKVEKIDKPNSASRLIISVFSLIALLITLGLLIGVMT